MGSSRKRQLAQPVLLISLLMRIYLVALLFIIQFAQAQSRHISPKVRQPENVWVDSIYNNLTQDERIAQLFMVAAYSNKDTAHVNSISRLIKNYKIGGLIFMQGGPGRQAKLTNRYQSESKVPLFIGIDAEWGLAMRLDSVARFPWNMTLGAIQDLSLIEKVGEEYGKQSRRMGIHFNFAPVLDINTNPRNPIIGNRSFGEDKQKVTERAMALMKGIQREGVLATGKHFPGHGDTAVDSHDVLPLVDFSKLRLDEVELYPYRQLFNEGLASVMVAHLNVPALETRDGYPSSISYNVVTNLLQNELGFKGLIFTDALNMKGASNFKSGGEIDLEAFMAGNDILLFPENVPLAMDRICAAYQDTLISEERLAQSVKKILRYKYRVGLDMRVPVDTENLYRDVNTIQNAALQYTLYENAVTVLKNDSAVLPIKSLENERIAYVKLGEDNHAPFLSTIQKYTEVTEIQNDSIHLMLERLKGYTTVIVGYHKSDGAWKNHDFKPDELSKLDSITKYHDKVILDVFAKPYSLIPIPDFSRIKGLVVSYQNSEVSQIVSGELLFGAVEAKGKLPVSINTNFKVGDGLPTEKLNRLGFTAPENVGMSTPLLTKIDMLANKAIEGRMTPGIQVLVARKGKVIYQKAFGYHTYEKMIKTANSDIYDVASLTKIVSTLPNVMQQFDQKKLTFESRLGQMLPVFRRGDKKNIHVKELLSHYARLQAWIPFYKATLDSAQRPADRYYRKMYDPMFSKQVAENLYIRNDYHDTVMKQIASSKLLPKKEYKYSDFAFIIMKEYLEKSTGKTLDSLSAHQFFRPLGMSSTMYNPLRKFDVSAIPPTEDDKYFRYQVVQGYVHDMEAAMEGGVAGHAGIFSNSVDLAKMMQLYLQKGNYGGRQYFSEKTFDEFNTAYFVKEGNRRGIGFDKPQLPGQAGPTCNCVSMKSFGHTGFTGTMAWADPETEIVYIFLSNRTFPDATVNALSKENIREDIQKVIQEAIIK